MRKLANIVLFFILRGVLFLPPVFYILFAYNDCPNPLLALHILLKVTVALDITLIALAVIQWWLQKLFGGDCCLCPECVFLLGFWSVLLLLCVFSIPWSITGIIATWSFSCPVLPLRVLSGIRMIVLFLEGAIGICSVKYWTEYLMQSLEK